MPQKRFGSLIYVNRIGLRLLSLFMLSKGTMRMTFFEPAVIVTAYCSAGSIAFVTSYGVPGSLRHHQPSHLYASMNRRVGAIAAKSVESVPCWISWSLVSAIGTYWGILDRALDIILSVSSSERRI